MDAREVQGSTTRRRRGDVRHRAERKRLPSNLWGAPLNGKRSIDLLPPPNQGAGSHDKSARKAAPERWRRKMDGCKERKETRKDRGACCIAELLRAGGILTGKWRRREIGYVRGGGELTDGKKGGRSQPNGTTKNHPLAPISFIGPAIHARQEKGVLSSEDRSSRHASSHQWKEDHLIATRGSLSINGRS